MNRLASVGFCCTRLLWRPSQLFTKLQEIADVRKNAVLFDRRSGDCVAELPFAQVRLDFETLNSAVMSLSNV